MSAMFVMVRRVRRSPAAQRLDSAARAGRTAAPSLRVAALDPVGRVARRLGLAPAH